MTNLGEASGLDIEMLLDEGALGVAFDPVLVDSAEEQHSLSERTIQAIRPVLRSRNAGGPPILYRMYRSMGLGAPGYRELASAAGLRYDITVLGSGILGKELLKTSGHCHPPTPQAFDLSYPEAYECIHGTVWFLMQKVDDARDIYKRRGEMRITDVVLAEVHAGERIIMPPNYGHVMVNPTDAIAVTSDWVCARFGSYYAPYEAHQGAAYYVLAGEAGAEAKLVPNKKYGCVRKPRRARPKQDVPELGLQAGLPLFKAFYAAPEKFRYLCEPHTAAEALASEQLFEFG